MLLLRPNSTGWSGCGDALSVHVILQKLMWFVSLVPVKNCEILFPLYIAFSWHNMFCSIFNNQSLFTKSRRALLLRIELLERKKNKEIFFLICPRKYDLTFHANCIPWRPCVWNVKSYFTGKIRKNLINSSPAESAHSVVINNSHMSVRKKKVLQNYAFPEKMDLFIYFILFSDYLLTKLLK